MIKKLKYFLDISTVLLMTHIKMLKQSNIGNDVLEISPPETNKTKNSFGTDGPKVNINNDSPCSKIRKKTRTSRAPCVKIDSTPVDIDIEEPQDSSNKRKRGRPPKFKNEITKSHWLGFFAFVSEHAYFDVPK